MVENFVLPGGIVTAKHFREVTVHESNHLFEVSFNHYLYRILSCL